jgi:hypothetical protein
MTVVATEKKEQNKAAVDPWTVVHFASGLALGLVGAPLKVWLPVATAYEVAEQYLEQSKVGKKLFDTHGPETLPNVLVDIAVFAVGHQLGRLWNETR